jgi:hypothetical protein
MLSGVAFAEGSSSGSKGADLKNFLDAQKQKIESRTASSSENMENGMRASSTLMMKFRDWASSTKERERENEAKRLDNRRLDILKPYEKALADLQGLATRVDSRISKLQAQGLDMSAANILLTTATADITIAQNDLADLTNALNSQQQNATSTVPTTTRKTLLNNLKNEAVKFKNDLKTAQADLVKVIESLKPGQKMASSTESASTTSTPAHE